MLTTKRKISVIGLGYVGLPVAVAFAKQGTVIGFDINKQRITELNEGYDCTLEVAAEELEGLDIIFTDVPEQIQQADFHIISVPTPVDSNKQPDLLPVLRASKTVGKQLKINDIVVYESTVYPGATEEVCIPVLEQQSGLTCGVDFSVGYSPERINPGDKKHSFTNIIKVVSGLDETTLQIVAEVYKSVITAGVHYAPSIKVAEAAKVVENTQRDINIAFMNELAVIFDRMQVDTADVLEAASTKWNFLNFKPGLVGGHCLAGSETIWIKDGDNIFLTSFADFVERKLKTKKSIMYHGTEIKFPNKNYEVLSFNPSTETTSFTKIRAFTKTRYDKLLKIKTSIGKEMLVSDKHPVIIKENEQYNVKLAQDVSKNDGIPIITKLPIIYQQQKINLIDLFKNSVLASKIRVKLKNKSWRDFNTLISKANLNKKVSNFFYFDYLPFIDYLKIRNQFLGLANENELLLVTGRGPSFSSIPAIFNIDENFARFIGYYLSEGCLTEDKSLRTRITLNKQEYELLDDLTSILNKWQIKFSIYQDKKCNAQTLKISNRLFGEMLRYLNTGKDSYDANIPNIIMFNNDKIRFEVLKGVLRGDGGFSLPAKFCYFSSSKQLFEKVVLLLHNFDIFPILQKREGLLEVCAKKQLEKLTDCVLDNKKTKLTTALNNISRYARSNNYHKADGFFISKVKNITEEINSTFLYSLEVPSTSNYIITNGIMTHNCIGIDPYYLVHKSKQLGHNPQIIPAARAINDGMGEFVSQKILEHLQDNGYLIPESTVTILGLSFKENVPDLRNTRVIDIVKSLQQHNIKVQIHDPLVDVQEVMAEYKISINSKQNLQKAQCVVLAVPHQEFIQAGWQWLQNLLEHGHGIVIDIKGILPRDNIPVGITLWRL